MADDHSGGIPHRVPISSHIEHPICCDVCCCVRGQQHSADRHVLGHSVCKNSAGAFDNRRGLCFNDICSASRAGHLHLPRISSGFLDGGDLAGIHGSSVF